MKLKGVKAVVEDFIREAPKDDEVKRKDAAVVAVVLASALSFKLVLKALDHVGFQG